MLKIISKRKFFIICKERSIKIRIYKKEIDEKRVINQKTDQRENDKGAVEILMDLLFNTIPGVEIYGISVVLYMSKLFDEISEISAVITRKNSLLIKLFLRALEKNNYLQEHKIRSFNQIFEHQMRVIIRDKPFLMILSVQLPLSQLYFTIFTNICALVY